MKAWFLLIIAGFFEIGWAVTMKYTNGFSKFLPSAITLILMGLSVYFLSLAIKSLPLGTAYAVWTGIGVIGTSVLGMILWNEPATVLRLIFILLIVIGIIGLKLFT